MCPRRGTKRCNRVLSHQLTNSPNLSVSKEVDQNIASWNPVISWLRRFERLKFAG